MIGWDEQQQRQCPVRQEDGGLIVRRQRGVGNSRHAESEVSGCSSASCGSRIWGRETASASVRR